MCAGGLRRNLYKEEWRGWHLRLKYFEPSGGSTYESWATAESRTTASGYVEVLQGRLCGPSFLHLFPDPSTSDRETGDFGSEAWGREVGSRVEKAFVDSVFSREEIAGRFMCVRTRVDGFFRYKGGLKMAAASPRRWGRGAVSYFAVALLQSLAAAILGWRAGRAARGTKWRQSRASSRPGFAPHKAAWGLGEKRHRPLESLPGV